MCNAEVVRAVLHATVLRVRSGVTARDSLPFAWYSRGAGDTGITGRRSYGSGCSSSLSSLRPSGVLVLDFAASHVLVTFSSSLEAFDVRRRLRPIYLLLYQWWRGSVAHCVSMPFRHLSLRQDCDVELALAPLKVRAVKTSPGSLWAGWAVVCFLSVPMCAAGAATNAAADSRGYLYSCMSRHVLFAFSIVPTFQCSLCFLSNQKFCL